MSQLIKKYLSIFIVIFNGTIIGKNEENKEKTVFGDLKAFHTKRYISKNKSHKTSPEVINTEIDSNEYTFSEYHQFFNQIIWHAFIEALSMKLYGKSFFNGPDTPKEIKQKISKYVYDLGIIIDNLKLPYGLIQSEPLNELIERIELNFIDFTNHYIQALNNQTDYDPILNNLNIEDLYSGNIEQEVYNKLQILSKKLAMTFTINYINSNILFTLGNLDGINQGSEMFMINNQIKIIKQNFSFQFCINEILNMLIKNNRSIMDQSKKNIYSIQCIKLKKYIPVENVKNKIDNTKINVNRALLNPYNYNLFDLGKIIDKDYPNELSSLDSRELSKENCKKYREFLDTTFSTEENYKNNNNFFPIEHDGSIYILPRYNPFNSFKPWIVADQFYEEKDAIEYGAKILAHEILDDTIMGSLIKNKGKIQIQTEENNVKKIYEIELQSFFKLLGAMITDEKDNTSKENYESKTFNVLRQFTHIALMEAASFLKTRKSLIGQPDSNLSHWAKARIVIDPILIQGISNKDSKIPSKPIVINFNELTFIILEYLKSNVLSFVDDFEAYFMNILHDEATQNELSLLINELLIKNIIIHKLKSTYVIGLFQMEQDDNNFIDGNYLESLKNIAVNSELIHNYLYRLLNVKKSLLKAEIERNRQVIYAIQIQCSNKEVRDTFISNINNIIKGLGNESQINILKYKLVKNDDSFKALAQIHHLTFSNLPIKIQEEYLTFIENENSGNFYIGIYEYFKEINSGNQYMIYILPKYDIRDVDKKPGFLEKNIHEVEIAMLFNKEINPYLLEIYKSNSEKLVYLTSLEFKNIPGKPTEVKFKPYAFSFSKMMGMLQIGIDKTNPARHYFNWIKKSNNITVPDKNPKNEEIIKKKIYYLSLENIQKVLSIKNDQKKSYLLKCVNDNNKNSDKSEFIKCTSEHIKELLKINNENQLNKFIEDLKTSPLNSSKK